MRAMKDENLFDSALACLLSCEAEEKVALTRSAAAAWRARRLLRATAAAAVTIPEPGRPALLRLGGACASQSLAHRMP